LPIAGSRLSEQHPGRRLPAEILAPFQG